MNSSYVNGATPVELNAAPEGDRRHDCLEEISNALERTGNYRILRRLAPRLEFGAAPFAQGDTKTCVVLDLETTGLDTLRDEPIEIGMVKIEYFPDGRLRRVTGTFSGFNEPSCSLPPEISRLTGITPAMLAGQKFNSEKISEFVSGADLCIAHNAGFDRRFAERYWPVFQHLAWACSATQVDWRGLGFESAKLTHILNAMALFHHAHRAVDDCHALLEVLSRAVPGQNETFFASLLSVARRPTWRVWAENAPFELKDVLKRRRYRWNDGFKGCSGSRPTPWDLAPVEGPVAQIFGYSWATKASSRFRASAA